MTIATCLRYSAVLVNIDVHHLPPLQASLRQLLRRLQKELSEVEWQLKDCEWRLDQEGAVSEASIPPHSSCEVPFFVRQCTKQRRKRVQF